MCGISGAFSIRRSQHLVDIVHSIVTSQHSRGPDFNRVSVVELPSVTAVLGHNRLSIVDVGDRAHQPMWDHARRRCIVFNGEIYNFVELRAELTSRGHTFATTSDTEVLLAAFAEWGDAAIERFNGMFAFALMDTQTNTLHLVRDRFGVKPLYYAIGREGVVFASTPTCLASTTHLEPNLKYLARGAATWLYEDETTSAPYDGMCAVPPGHRVELRRRDTSISAETVRYYDLDARVEAESQAIAGLSERALRERVLATLESAVDVRLRADVPLAVSLSGGLDSTTVAALVSTRHAATTGFCFGHPSATGSEAPVVEQFARSAGIRVEYIWPDARQIVDAFWRTLDAQGAPFASASVVAQYLVFERVRQNGFKVLLGGQGGDEAFMGYRKFHVFRAQSLARAKRWGELAAALGSLSYLMAAELPRVRENWRLRNRYAGAESSSKLALPKPDAELRLVAGESLVQRQLADITRHSLPTLLRYEDRNSMAHSVESRLPFVDYRIVELGLALPTSVKLRRGHGKAIVRDVVRGHVPDVIRLSRYKRGFDVEQARWIADGLGASMRAGLHDHWPRVREFVAPGVMIDDAFSDRALGASKTAFVDATTLLWLAARKSNETRVQVEMPAAV
jgi:asparagine synthase (glutamine-hydrolysing)